MLKKILIANRGEIACRIARTCRKLGLSVATVHSSADRFARHVREIGESVEIGGPRPARVTSTSTPSSRRPGASAPTPCIRATASSPRMQTSCARLKRLA
ncbi:biotin carboxylase N-terminal domain-containing protein [Ottowia sp. VDI28]